MTHTDGQPRDTRRSGTARRRHAATPWGGTRPQPTRNATRMPPRKRGKSNGQRAMWRCRAGTGRHNSLTRKTAGGRQVKAETRQAKLTREAAARTHHAEIKEHKSSTQGTTATQEKGHTKS
ncbi:hypothetical protein TRVL_08064 [Trypanosoma vivax]|nr:hypothetical protein TRVL_08064 [Trypanosoma vivax]